LPAIRCDTAILMNRRRIKREHNTYMAFSANTTLLGH